VVAAKRNFQLAASDLEKWEMRQKMQNMLANKYVYKSAIYHLLTVRVIQITHSVPR
jgi:hypothetical protein